MDRILEFRIGQAMRPLLSLDLAFPILLGDLHRVRQITIVNLNPGGVQGPDVAGQKPLSAVA